MKKLVGYLLTPLHLLVFGLVLVVFHPIQWIAFNLGGYTPHKKTVDIMNGFLMYSLWALGTSLRFENRQDLPTDRPLIVVSNHQSMHDIAAFFWHLRKHHVKFVSKIELAHGIPSVSYNLRHGGSATIDRKNPRQALTELKKFAEYIEANNYCAVIFPEGTRSRNGEPKSFSIRGFQALMKYAPSAVVVPVTINNSWKLYQHGKFPMSPFEKLSWKVHPYVETKGRKAEDVLAEVEAIIKADIKI